MKMQEKDFTNLRNAIAVLDDDETRDLYRQGLFPRADKVIDLNKRYRWDLATKAIGGRGICELYDLGLNDTHIDTALRAIVKPL